MLNEGANIIEITGKNQAGASTEKTTINYKSPLKVPRALPEVTILTPGTTPYNNNEAYQEIIANVTGKPKVKNS